MNNINKFDYKNSKYLIKKFIGKSTFNKDINYANIILHNYDESPFMGDLEMLIILNKQLHKFEQNSLNNELNLIDEKYRYKVESIIKKFIYILLEYTLTLITITSDLIKNDKNKIKLKQELINYSIGIVYRISQYVQEQIKSVMLKNKQIHNTIKTSIGLKNLIDLKLDKCNNMLESNMLEQTMLDNTMLESNLHGGSHIEKSSDSESNMLVLSESSNSSESSSINNISSIELTPDSFTQSSTQFSGIYNV